MSKRALEATVMKGSAPAATFEFRADPDDVGTLQDALTAWLQGDGWKRPTWGQFRLEVRYQGEWKVRKTVRAPAP